jgi:DNA-binding response OmpR family regulator
LLTDIRMPGMDGNELISRIRALEPVGERKPIIAATASAMEADVQQCLDAGADDVIAKPLMLDTLQQALDNWMPQLKTYAEAMPKSLFDIRQAFAWNNLDQLGDFAHRLKSSSSSLGALQIAQICNGRSGAKRAPYPAVA